MQTHVERQRLQYALSDHARELGFGVVEVIDEDLGLSGAGVHRPGFDALLEAVCKGRVGLVLSIEAFRPSRNGREWHTLLDFCAIVSCLMGDRERPYDPALIDDRMYLGLLCGGPHKSPVAKRSWQSFSKTCKRISTLPATPSALGR
ncbi:MAG: recombinase family protein [Chloroflexota bacterium]|nr:recombinase family protein [Chloroflexota bacterium]